MGSVSCDAAGVDEWNDHRVRRKKKIVMIAGPNGAGKTTFAQEFLPNEAGCPIFVNADLIAAGLSPFRPEAAAIRAGRLMLREIAAHVRRKESFALESTLGGYRYVRLIPEWRRVGYLRHADLSKLTDTGNSHGQGRCESGPRRASSSRGCYPAAVCHRMA